MGGRGKLSMKFMSNRKSRISTFKKRKNSLMKKAYELSTLCDVRTCVLIHGPASAPDEDRSQSQSDVEFHTWPPNRSEIEALIRAYKNNDCLQQKRKCFDLHDFFFDRKSKIETEMCKIRANVEEVLCPNWNDRLEGLSEHELRDFMDGLDSKIEAATGMIGFMEADYDHLLDEVPLPTEFSYQNAAAMGGDLKNPPVMPPPLLELDFPEFSVSPNGDEQYNFEPIQLLFEEEDDNDVTQFINLMNTEIDRYSNNLEYLMMGGAGNF